MKREKRDFSGIVLSILLNLALHFEWGLAAAIFAVLSHYFGIPSFFWIACLIIWPLHAIIMTGLLSWAADCADTPPIQQRNKNPYSAKNRSYFAQADDTQQTSDPE